MAMAEPIDPGVDIGHVHLKVADIDRALAFYCDVLGFELHAALRRGGRLRLGRRLPPPHRPQHLGVEGGSPPPPGTHRPLSLRNPLSDPARPCRRSAAPDRQRVPLGGASDHGVSEALYLADPDGNGIELYWDRPNEEWPQPAPGEKVAMQTRPLDLHDLLAELKID